MEVRGAWASQWGSVIDTFVANFTDAGEQGAGIAVYYRGELVIDACAGSYSNRLAGCIDQPWDENTLVNIFSAGKGLVALSVLQLFAAGKLDIDAPIARYWSEFAQAGKSAITARQVLCHRSGLSAFQQHIADTQIFDWERMITTVATESSWWPAGSAQGYAPFMFGWILGELVCRVSGAASFDDYFQANIAVPLDMSCHFGVPVPALGNIADMAPLKRALGASAGSKGADSVALGLLMKADPRGVTNRAFSNPASLLTTANTREWRQAQIPAANAHSNARSIAAFYGALASGNRLLPADTASLCWQEQTFQQDQVLGLPLRFSNGFMLSQPDRADCRYGRGIRAFGHPGAGGCVGFADPDYEVGFGYVTGRMGQSLLIDNRAVGLIDAVYNLIGKLQHE